MNSFQRASQVEIKSMERLIPFLEQKSYRGRLVITNKGPLSEFLQRTVGDMLFNTESSVYSIELKTEEKNSHNNFFLETWSNLNYSPRKTGWMFTLQCDLLWYYFLETDELYSIRFKSLWEWAFVYRNIYRFNEKPQGKYGQLNKTVGRCVPISVIKNEVGFKLMYPMELLTNRVGRF
jgi:hypothetical protein